MCGGPQEHTTYELVPASPAVSCMSASSNLNSFRDKKKFKKCNVFISKTVEVDAYKNVFFIVIFQRNLELLICVSVLFMVRYYIFKQHFSTANETKTHINDST